MRSLSFLLDNALVIARGVRWDSLDGAGTLTYQRLAGDHPIVPTREMRVATPTIEADSLYMLDSDKNLHLLRPFLIGTNCEECGSFSIFYADTFAGGKLNMKSMEHGHVIKASDGLQHAARRSGLLPDEAGRRE
jgi:hypothetical protein